MRLEVPIDYQHFQLIVAEKSTEKHLLSGESQVSSEPGATSEYTLVIQFLVTVPHESGHSVQNMRD